MKRKIILIVIVFIFNVIWLFGFNYTNKFLDNHNLVIKIGKEEIKKVETNDNSIFDLNVSDYNGEDYKKISEKINKNLKGTKLEDKGELIVKYSINKNVDPYFIGAMIMVNTNCEVQCTSIVEKCNNVGDLLGTEKGCFGGSYRKYKSIDDGIKDFVDYVANNFYAKDLKTPNDVYKTYNKNIAWSYKVSRYMEKIKK